MNKSKKLLFLLESFNFVIPIALGAPEHEGDDDDWSEVEFQVEAEFEPDEPESGYRGGGWSINSYTIDEPFTFMGKSYKVGSEFPKELIKYIQDFEGDTPKDLENWLKDKVEAQAEKKRDKY